MFISPKRTARVKMWQKTIVLEQEFFEEMHGYSSHKSSLKSQIWEFSLNTTLLMRVV
jgi:hypothetical protein